MFAWKKLWYEQNLRVILRVATNFRFIESKSEAYSEPCQAYKMEIFCKSSYSSILDFLQVSEYAFASNTNVFMKRSIDRSQNFCYISKIFVIS